MYVMTLYYFACPMKIMGLIRIASSYTLAKHCRNIVKKSRSGTSSDSNMAQVCVCKRVIKNPGNSPPYSVVNFTYHPPCWVSRIKYFLIVRTGSNIHMIQNNSLQIFYAISAYKFIICMRIKSIIYIYITSLKTKLYYRNFY